MDLLQQKWNEYVSAVEAENAERHKYNERITAFRYVQHQFLWWKWQEYVPAHCLRFKLMKDMVEPTIEGLLEWNRTGKV